MRASGSVADSAQFRPAASDASVVASTPPAPSPPITSSAPLGSTTVVWNARAVTSVAYDDVYAPVLIVYRATALLYPFLTSPPIK